MGKGKLIVFEGTDGSGKETQSRLLYQRLKREGIDCRRLNFPRYGEQSCGPVELYLRGALGEKPGDVNAYAASSFYAVDRFCSYRQDWGSYYERGGLLLADRYTTSNAVHQASKLPPAERKGFLDWLFGYEYGLLGLPAPTAVFYLNVPVDLAEKLLENRQVSRNAASDIHERDEGYLRACQETGRQLVNEYGWQLVNCENGDAMRTVDDIHEELYRRALALMD